MIKQFRRRQSGSAKRSAIQKLELANPDREKTIAPDTLAKAEQAMFEAATGASADLIRQLPALQPDHPAREWTSLKKMEEAERALFGK